MPDSMLAAALATSVVIQQPSRRSISRVKACMVHCAMLPVVPVVSRPMSLASQHTWVEQAVVPPQQPARVRKEMVAS